MELVSESRERCSFDCGILFLVLFLFGVLGQGGYVFSGNYDCSALGYLFGDSRFILVHLSIVP